mmetsp:Transcript_27821/g.86609  ORF Transcript_27821/g.86609 Transcript_27821/m.86609 type:complete len:243 (-) Transcript_27821:112-840(-)
MFGAIRTDVQVAGSGANNSSSGSTGMNTSHSSSSLDSSSGTMVSSSGGRPGRPNIPLPDNIPLPEGVSLSRGSKNHHRGMCRPCIACYAPGGCPSGGMCNFCHYPHDASKMAEVNHYSNKAVMRRQKHQRSRESRDGMSSAQSIGQSSGQSGQSGQQEGGGAEAVARPLSADPAVAAAVTVVARATAAQAAAARPPPGLPPPAQAAVPQSGTWQWMLMAQESSGQAQSSPPAMPVTITRMSL